MSVSVLLLSACSTTMILEEKALLWRIFKPKGATCNSNETPSYFMKEGEASHRNVTVKNYLSFYMISLC